MSCLKYSNSLSVEFIWFVQGVGEFFHFTWGLERKQGPCIWVIITFFFSHSKANAPYFSRVGGWGFQLIGALAVYTQNSD